MADADAQVRIWEARPLPCLLWYWGATSSHSSCEMETPGCPSKQLPADGYMKPKQEPCEDLPPPASDAAEGWETNPLSGNPFFTSVMSRTQVQQPFTLVGGDVSK